ncbi:MAG TPA: lipase family protein [Bacillota bacterium]|nr:lipase family protein [Bacillota bacterium]
MKGEDILYAMELSGLAYREVQPVYQSGVIEFISDPVTDVQCYLRRCGKTLYITFRGSDSPRDWKTNFMFDKMTIPYGNTASPIRVHRGFITAYKSPFVRNAIHRAVSCGVESVKIAGHSQGAALAILCSVDLEYNFPDLDYEVYLFGAPRVGNKAFRDSYNRRLLKVFRIENGNDIVTKLPPAFLGYRHVGMKIHIGCPRLPFMLSIADHYPQQYYRNIIRKFACAR